MFTDLAVGLWPVGAGALLGDAELGTRAPPGVGHVGRAVVGKDSFDGDPVVAEPRRGALEDLGGGLLGLVIMGFE
jgi:hypothetical protein